LLRFAQLFLAKFNKTINWSFYPQGLTSQSQIFNTKFKRVLEAAKKLHGQDVSVFVIGIGNESQMNIKMMNQIATEPITKHIKYANTVEGINKVIISFLAACLKLISV